jgi:hypothetical protein
LVQQETTHLHHTPHKKKCSGSGGGAAATPAGGSSGVALLSLRRGRAADALATADVDDRCALAGGGAGRGGQRRGVGPLTRRLAGAAASLCLARVWAGTLTCRLAGGGAGRGGQRRGVGPLTRQWGAAARGQTADALARGGSGVALLGSRLGRDDDRCTLAGGGTGRGGCWEKWPSLPLSVLKHTEPDLSY